MATVDFPSQVSDTSPTFLVGGNAALNSGAGGPSKAVTGATGRTVLAATTASEAIVALALKTPQPHASHYTLVPEDNGKTLVLTATPLITIDDGLPVGFGCTVKGNFTVDGTADVTDVREIRGVASWCSLIQTAADTYDLVGNKVLSLLIPVIVSTVVTVSVALV